MGGSIRLAFTEPGQAINVKGTPITEFGDLARRAGRGPGTRNLDFSVFRNFAIREHMRLQFRAEAFNISNTPAFFLPAANSTGVNHWKLEFQTVGRIRGGSPAGPIRPQIVFLKRRGPGEFLVAL